LAAIDITTPATANIAIKNRKTKVSIGPSSALSAFFSDAAEP